TYAEAVAAGDECVSALAKEWRITPDLEKMIEAPKPLEVPDAPKAEAKVPEAFTLAPYGQPGTDSRPTKPAGKDGDQTGRTPEKGDRARSSNLLASVDLKKGALSGNWAKDGESVTCQPDNPARLVLPAAPKSDEYDLRIEFTRHSGNQGFGACLTSGNRTFLLQVSAVDNQYVAVTDFKDVAKDDWARRNLKYPMPTGKRQVMVIHVRKDGVRADLDGKEFYAYATDFSNHVRNEWGFRPRTLGLVSWLNVVTFYSVELVEGDALNAAAELPARCRIVNKASGKVLSIPNQNRGNSVELVAAGREVSQEWEILSIGRGRVRLCNRLADTCLGVRGESLKPDTDILNWIGRDAPAKAKAEGADWVIEDTGDGYVRIRNALSGLYFAAERDRGFQKDRAAAESQLWKLESLDAKLPEPAAEPKQPSLAGDWLLSSITNFHMTITLREDGTIGRPDGLKGRWTLGGDKLVADYGVIVDTFSGHDGDAWVGTNSEGTKIRLDRGKADAAPTRVFKSINEIVAAVPADVIPAKGRPWTTVKADAANVVISQNLDGQAFRVQVKVVDLPKWDGKGMLYSAVDLPQGFPIRIFAHFDDQERAKLGSLNIGDSVLLTGTFMRGQNQVLNLWNSWGFSVNLEKCSVDKIR
ncbi:MAG TPA: RICIN domain-containing protein, partial [Roseimicrobium sp.]|nr:RICIN domain-containing protein [Roseimicrobium sp.]